MKHTDSHSGRLNGCTPVEFVTGDILYIAELLDFSFYDQCWYKENAGLGETHIGKWLDVSHCLGPLMSYWILTSQGTVISWTTVQRITYLETQTADNKERFRLFDLSIHEFFKDEIIVTVGAKPNPASWAEIIGDDPDFEETFKGLSVTRIFLNLMIASHQTRTTGTCIWNWLLIVLTMAHSLLK